MRRRGALLATLFVLGSSAAAAARADTGDICRKVLAERIRSCTDRCIARAKAAVDPEVAARFKGYGCARNCSRQEVWEQHECPEGQ